MISRPRKVIVAGEIWSSNLGDGVIADSIQFLLKQIQSDLQVQCLDISGRNATTSAQSRAMSPVKQFLHSKQVLRPFLNILRGRVLKRHQLQTWTAMLSDADIVLIGGGQLLMDNALEFPLKISIVSDLAHSLGKPVHFVSCGVGKQWSFLAKRLFHKALSNSVSVTVRDTASVERLQRLLPGIGVSLSADPALWAAEIYGRPERRDRNLVGLGIINADLIKRYQAANFTLDELIGFWVEIANQLHQRKIDFELFTNGSLDDYEFAQLIAREIEKRLSIPCTLVKRPVVADELAQNIGRYNAIVAARLHAHIIATSYRIPSIALVWDDKVRTFFKDTGRASLVYDSFSLSTANQVVVSLTEIINEPVSEQILDEKRSLVLENLQTILNAQS